jgi:3-hydroxyacyl-CoA dehydrogenase
VSLKDDLIRRFQLAAFVEAALVLEAGIATPRDIDIALRAGAGLPQGPLEWADQVGLQHVLAELEELDPEFPDGRFHPPASLVQRVRQGRLGQVSGRGYRDWGDSRE